MERFRTELNGYSKEEVNKFVNTVIREIESNLERIKNQENDIASLKAELLRYHELENRINSAFEQAKTTNDEMRKIAEKEADMIISEARHNASRIVNDALLKSQKLIDDRERLNQTLKAYKRKVKSALMEQLEIIEDIEVL